MRLEKLIAQLHDLTTAATRSTGKVEWDFTEVDVSQCRSNLRDALKTLDEIEGALEEVSDES